MRKLLLIGALLGLACVTKHASAQVEVDAREVIRRGDMVEHITDEFAAADPVAEAFGQVSSLPDNDADKWFVYVISRKNCPACETLKTQWASDKWLRAYAVPETPKESWAHFTWYDYNDPLQNWRWTKSPSNPNAVTIAAFPTIIVQPPRSGIYGNPSTVVFQYVYEGDPKTFSEKVNAAIKRYLELLQRKNALPAGRSGVPAIGGFRALETAAPLVVDAAADLPADQSEPLHIETVMQHPSLLQFVRFKATPNEDAPPAFGQQQIPPLNLPNEPKDEPPANTPVRDTLSSLLNQPEIVVVRDPQQRRSDGVEEAIDAKIASLQPEGGEPYNVKEIPVEKNPYGVVPEDAPAVLLVRGKHVSQKLTARVEEEKGFLSLLLAVPLIAAFLGGGSTASIIGMFLKFLMFLIFGGMVLLVLVLLLSRTQHVQVQAAPQAPAPTPAAPVGQTLTDEERAALKALTAQRAAAQAKAKATQAAADE
jgi:hypothetical protein